MVFVTLFLGTKNEHLTKDVGAIPYFLNKKYSIDSFIATYKNDVYRNLDNDTNGLKLLFIHKNFCEIIDGLLFLLKNSNKIDVLNLYHISLKSLVWSICYKLLKRKGIIFLKTDASFNTIQKNKKSFLRKYFCKILLKLSDIVSVESKAIKKQLFFDLYKKNYLLLKNGFFDYDNDSYQLNKEKIILFVGRVDAPEKNVISLIKAYLNSSIKNDWLLYLVGPYSVSFYDKVKALCSGTDLLNKGKINFLGPIYDRKLLSDIYSKSSIFVLPSEYESYGIVLVEALSSGNYLLGSNNIPSFSEISRNYEFGKAINPLNLSEFTKELEKTVLKVSFDKSLCYRAINYANKEYKWSKIVDKLYNKLKLFSSI